MERKCAPPLSLEPSYRNPGARRCPTHASRVGSVQEVSRGRKRRTEKATGEERRAATHLLRVHLKFSHDLDGDLVVYLIIVARAIDIAEGAVAHLLDQGPAFQAGIMGELAFVLTLFRHYPLQHVAINVLGLLLALLLLISRASCHVAGPCGDIAPIPGDRGGVVVILCRSSGRRR